MVKITELAAQKVKEIQKAQHKENSFLRINLINEGGSEPLFGMTSEESITEDDLLYEEYGISIIADIGLAATLEGTILDYNESAHGGGFAIRKEDTGHAGGCAGSCGNCGGSCDHTNNL